MRRTDALQDCWRSSCREAASLPELLSYAASVACSSNSSGKY